MCAKKFLSTPSARRATRTRPTRASSGWNFYPRPPRGGRPESLRVCGRELAISIHALREEGDTCAEPLWPELMLFLSTPSARRATAGADRHRQLDHDFYPRPPRGGRRLPWRGSSGHRNFYPRPPRGGRLLEQTDIGSWIMISIHALREEGDLQCLVTWSSHRYFYPRPPRGGRLVQ